MLTLWKEDYDQPGHHIKKQRHYFVNKCPSSQGYSFSSSHVWMWDLGHTKCQKIGTFELWRCRRLLRVSWTARRSNQSILKEIIPEYSLEGLMLKLKWRAYSLENTLMLWKIEGRRRMSWSRRGLVKNFQIWNRMRGKIKFIRVGDAVTTVGQLKGELTLNRGP